MDDRKEREQLKLRMFFDPDRWERLLNQAHEKELNRTLIQYFMTPKGRAELYDRIVNHNYAIQVPHKTKIPKDTGGFRIVYANEDEDRIYLSVYNDMMSELHSDRVHKNCKSYQKGISCGNTVKEVSKQLTKYHRGYKADMTHYFDSVPLREILHVFDVLEMDTCLDIPVVNYYKSNLVFDEDDNLIEEYSGMKQGCAFSSFLANTLLYEVDKEISEIEDVLYVRYSDDILIVGKNADIAMNKLKLRLAIMGLSLNPKKTEVISNERWFEFLGFKIKGKQITFSRKSVRTLITEINKCTIKYKLHTRKGIVHDISPTKAINKINRYLYKNYTVNRKKEFGWAEYFLPIVNVYQDINTLDEYIKDCIRATYTKHKKVGGIGSIDNNDKFTVNRNNRNQIGYNIENTDKEIEGYISMIAMWDTIRTDKDAFRTKARTL